MTITPKEELLELQQVVNEPEPVADICEIKTIEDINPDIVQHLNGIEQAFEAYSYLVNIREILKDKKSLDDNTVKIARIAIENIRNDLSIYTDTAIVSTETFIDNTFSLEGFSSALNDIWQAIVRTFKSIWEKIKSFFSSKKAEVHKEHAKAVVIKIKADVKESKTKEPSEVKTPEDVSKHLQLNLEIASKRFSHLSSPIHVNDLINEIHKLKESMSSCEVLGRMLEVANINMLEAVNKLEANNGTLDGPASSFGARGVVVYYDAIAQCFKKGDDIYPYRDELREKLSVDYNKVDRNSVRSLFGFSRGSKIFAFQQSGNDLDSIIYKFLITKELETSKQKTIADFKSYKEVQVYGEEIVTLFEEYVNLIDAYANHSRRIISKQDDLMTQMSKFIHNGNQTNEDIQSKLILFRAVAQALGKATYTLNAFITLAEQSAMDHSRLLSAAFQVWSETVDS